MRKLHWTQTQRGSRILSKRAKEFWRTHKWPNQEKRKNHANIISEENQIAYALGYTKAWLHIYADSISLPRSIITKRVGELLQLS